MHAALQVRRLNFPNINQEKDYNHILNQVVNSGLYFPKSNTIYIVTIYIYIYTNNS